MNERESSEAIPIDLVIEILSRLPSKSIGRCRCVSKFWGSILSDPYFTELFMTRSLARPKLLFTKRYIKNDKVLFFSSPQPQSHDVKSSFVATNLDMNFPVDDLWEFCSPVNGLVCLIDKRIVKGRTERVPVICDPCTGRSLTLPRVMTTVGTSFLGYDPADKQFKLLSMACGRNPTEHQILTLGTEKLSWRMIECSIPHCPINNRQHPFYDAVCINGVLYYKAVTSEKRYGIACFDVRSERFKFLEEAKITEVILVNYKGKLATLKSDIPSSRFGSVSGKNSSFELCVLEDSEKHEWSKRTYVLPPMWKDTVLDVMLRIVGVTRLGEVVLCSYYRSETKTFNLFYYNLERNTIAKFGIRGMESFIYSNSVNTVLDHVENVNLGEVFRTS